MIIIRQEYHFLGFEILFLDIVSPTTQQAVQTDARFDNLSAIAWYSICLDSLGDAIQNNPILNWTPQMYTECKNNRNLEILRHEKLTHFIKPKYVFSVQN